MSSFFFKVTDSAQERTNLLNFLLSTVADNQGAKGNDGDSAYEIALSLGFVGNEAEWIQSLKGAKGDKGDSYSPSATGASSERSLYDGELAGFSFLDIDNSLLFIKRSDTFGDWFDGMLFGKGDKGDSAYQTALELGFIGTEAQWIASLKGDKGDSITSVTHDKSGKITNVKVYIEGSLADSFNINDGLDGSIGDVSVLLDDSQAVLNKTYTSSKIQALHDLQAQSILNLSTAQGEFIGTGSPTVLALTTTEQTIPITVTVPSTNSDVFTFDDMLDSVTFNINASFNFKTAIALSIGTISTRTITITGRNLLDNSIIYTRQVTVSGGIGDIVHVNSNQLVTVGRNGIQDAPLQIYFTIKADGTGVTLRDLSSQLSSSSSYDLPIYDASGIVVTPSGNISATNVQTALQELDTEKATFEIEGNYKGLVTVNSNTTLPESSTGYLFVMLSGTSINLPDTALVRLGARYTIKNLTGSTVSLALTNGSIDSYRMTILDKESLSIMYAGSGSWRVLNRSTEEAVSVGSGINLDTTYHIYGGEVSLSNSVVTSGASANIYTGNGSTQAITTTVPMSGQWGNDASESYGGLVWIKGRSTALDHILCDTIRGISLPISSNLTVAQYSASTVNGFLANGFSLGGSSASNTNLGTYLALSFGTTHIRTGTTNHGKAYTEHYNPFTGFTIIKYEGSGITGHEISHSLGRKLDLLHIKNLSSTVDWISGNNNYQLNLSRTDACVAVTAWNNQDTKTTILATGVASNQSTNQYILYGWADSYFDDNSKLIGNYEIGIYEGNSLTSNFVPTRKRPAYILQKRLTGTGNWNMFDVKRSNFDAYLQANTSAVESSVDWFDVSDFGFTWKISGTEQNNAGDKYLYMVVYDNDSASGISKYDRATDTSALSINAFVPLANGFDTGGKKVSISYRNETMTLANSLISGANYVYLKEDGTYNATQDEPCYNGRYNGFGDVFDIENNKWYSSPSLFNDRMNTTTNWIADEATGGTASTISSINGELKILNNGATYGATRRVETTVIGKKYKIVFKLCSLSSTYLSLWIGTAIRGNTISNVSHTASGDKEVTFVATSTSTHVMFLNVNTSGAISTIDNYSIIPLNDDGSVNLYSGLSVTPRNYLDVVVYADSNGQPSYVEQIAKTKYFTNLSTESIDVKNRIIPAGAKFLNIAVDDKTTLDWYEEGTFTPIVLGATTAGVGTYSIATGRYTRIGNIVNFNLYIVVASHTGTGAMKISGLPFVHEAQSGVGTSVQIGFASLLTFTGTPTAFIETGSTSILLMSATSNTTSGDIQIDTSFGIIVSGSYRV